jgi:hypothetical protein
MIAVRNIDVDDRQAADAVTGWQLPARWHRGRPDDVASNEFTHDRRAARVAPIVRNRGRCDRTRDRHEERT